MLQRYEKPMQKQCTGYKNINDYHLQDNDNLMRSFGETCTSTPSDPFVY
jgi:hypothetical protein